MPIFQNVNTSSIKRYVILEGQKFESINQINCVGIILFDKSAWVMRHVSNLAYGHLKKNPPPDFSCIIFGSIFLTPGNGALAEKTFSREKRGGVNCGTFTGR
jgi:hypothetical protein